MAIFVNVDFKVIAAVILGPFCIKKFAFIDVIDQFGDIGRMIAGAFGIFGDKQQMGRLGDIAGFSII